MGSLSSKTSAPLATRSEGRMQEIQGVVSGQPPPRSCARPDSHSPTWPQSVPFKPVLLPSPTQLVSEERKVSQTMLSVGSYPGLLGLPCCTPPHVGSDTLPLHSGSSGPQPGLCRPLLALGRVCRLCQKTGGWLGWRGWRDPGTGPGRGPESDR